MSSNVSSTTSLTLSITYNKKLGVAFERLIYATILNEPENYQINDVIIKVNAYDYDNLNEPLNYNIIGPFQDRFQNLIF